ncbi:hypothetical protein [Rahnella sp. ChDrAdgB13]|uniref:hypothetical protein n=1 Tax=Rahnella sp. ChDrAdgB13 TaxID=1850581 RepID=UPI001AD869BE|nr:hypothetical protein [Rahnella sp. ChDrAdgB13]
MEMLTMDTVQSFIFSLVGAGLIWSVKRLYGSIDDLRRDNARIRELYQLKSDAVRDQEQIMAMLSEIKQSIERTNERVDRLIDGIGSR